jgi:hypothetical protein
VNIRLCMMSSVGILTCIGKTRVRIPVGAGICAFAITVSGPALVTWDSFSVDKTAGTWSWPPPSSAKGEIACSCTCAHLFSAWRGCGPDRSTGAQWQAFANTVMNGRVSWAAVDCAVLRSDRLDYEDGCLLGCCAVQTGRYLPFKRCLLPPSERWCRQ